MRHPYIRAWQLGIRNQLASWQGMPHRSRLWLSVLESTVAIALAVLAIRQSAGVVLHLLAIHSLTLSVLAALQASVLTHVARYRWSAVYARDWLSTLPVTRSMSQGRIVLRSILPTLLFPLAVAAVVLSAADDSGQSVAATGSVVVECLLATVFGGVLGWWLPRRTSAPRSGTRANATIFAGRSPVSLSPLSRWPPLQARAWLPPRLQARLMVPAMLLLPMDVSANVAIALLCLWAIGGYLCVLLRAQVRITRDGALWLRPTPLRFRRFAWVVTRHSLLRQAQWTVLAAVLLIALGCRPSMAIRVAETWLAVVGIVVAIGLTHTRDSRFMRLKIATSICSVIALDQLKQHLGTLTAALACLWMMRRTVRA